MKVFVSGQINEKQRIRDVYKKLVDLGFEITYDWTRTDPIGDKLSNRAESGIRAVKDITGVADADIYILMSDNKKAGKGMYVELGAALLRAQRNEDIKIYTVGPLNHLSIFYLHPQLMHFDNVSDLLRHLKNSKK